MGKLVIKFEGQWLGDVSLKLGDTTIGRSPSCDIVLDDKRVSKNHAVIKTVGLVSTIQDLGSTNGTFIENDRIKRHQLQQGDTIIIGGHTLLYRDDMNFDAPTFSAGQHSSSASDDSQGETKIITGSAYLIGVDGKDKGKRFSLVKTEVTLDNPGKSPARILRTGAGYVLHGQIGPGEPRINDKPIPPGGQLLARGDVVEVAGTKYQFYK
jgi:hypothetical protein